MQSINSGIIKASLLNLYGFKKAMYTCTELQYHLGIADVFAIPKKNINELYDFEIKITKSDMENDYITKTQKHLFFRKMYENTFDDFIKDYAKENKIRNYDYMKNLPNKFYFVVPSYLVEDCKKLIKEQNTEYYGIIEYEELWVHKNKLQEQLILEDTLKIVHPAKKLRKTIENTTYDYFKNIMLHRLRNDCIGFYKEKYFETNRYKPILREKKNG